MDRSALRNKRLFLLDMDGTLYLGDSVFAYTRDFLRSVRAVGGTYLFLTNNSSKSRRDYAANLCRLGIPATEEDFITSTDALIARLRRDYTGKTPLFYVQGTRSFADQLREAGFALTDTLCDGVTALVSGYDTELTFRKLEDACILLGRGADWYATNPDWVCPTAYGYVPDCGSVSEMLTRATGRRPVFVGKPEPEMIRFAMQRCGVSAAETVTIGDRLYTDVRAGINAGVDTVLVLSGETTAAQERAGDIHPTWVLDSVQDVTEVLMGRNEP